jgi:hypothetical protein
MPQRNPLALNRSVSVILQSTVPNVPPYAVRLSLARVSRYALFLFLLFATFFLGTLLFFRELELNRKLQEHVLRLETEKRLYQTYPLPERVLAAAPPVALAPPAPTETPAESPAETFARINELRTDCLEGTCSVKLGMVTTRPGAAVGQLLLVLETEVPRIGSAGPNSPVRKRYFLSPGETSLDELDPNRLSTFDQKPFRFSRGLQTTSAFKIGKLLRPLAINAYIFDTEKTLLHHERKVVTGDGVEP